MRGSLLVIGVNKEILSLRAADSLQSMTDVMKFEKVHNRKIRSLVISKDGKYYLFFFIMYLCISYSLCYYLIKNHIFEDMLLLEVGASQLRFSIQKVANVLNILRIRIMI